MTSYQSTNLLALPKPKRECSEHIYRLTEMLTYRRPAGSRTEKRFLERFIYPLDVLEDDYGNIIKQIGESPIMWSCHTDTVHKQGGEQHLAIAKGFVSTNDPQSNCLGADCTAGVWLMTEMIKAEVPGLYIFHRAEEIGGKGSTFLASNHPELFDGIKFAIAFDRRATGSIISHQMMGRCCSQEFIDSLATALGMGHKADSGGTFTDTANYVDLIGECTNISVGYYNEHSKNEMLDLDYIDELRWSLLSSDFSGLVAKREPGDVEDLWEDYDSDYFGRSRNSYRGWELWDDVDQTPSRTNRTLASLVRDHYDEVADFLEEEGMDAKTLAQIIYARGGAIKVS